MAKPTHCYTSLDVTRDWKTALLLTQTFYIRICFSLWFCNKALLQRRKKGENENYIPNISTRWTRSPLSVSLGHLFSLYCISVFFFIYAKENSSPVFACVSVLGRLLFPSWIDLCWNQDVHFSRDALSYHRSVLQVCRFLWRARENCSSSQQHLVATKCLLEH